MLLTVLLPNLGSNYFRKPGQGSSYDYYQSHTRAGRTECRILLNNGLALMVSETFPDEAIYHLMNNIWRRKYLIEMAKAVGRPNATRDLCNHIMSLK